MEGGHGSSVRRVIAMEGSNRSSVRQVAAMEGGHGRSMKAPMLRATAWLLNFEGQHLQKKKKAKGSNLLFHSFIHASSKCHYTDIYSYEGDKARQALTEKIKRITIS